MDAFERWWAGYAGNIIPEHQAGVKAACRFAFMAGHLAEQRRAAPRWGEEPPTAPGWYWYKNPRAFATLVLVEARAGDGSLRMVSDEYGCSANLPTAGEWCGPLPVPGEVVA